MPYEKIGNNEPVCIADEAPFEIPDSWEWIRIGTIASVISDGTHKTPNYVETGVPFLSVQNISKGYFDLTNIKYITKDEHEKLIQRIKPQIDDILFCRIGTLGKAIKCNIDFDFSIFVSLGLIRLVETMMTDYIIFVINSPLGDRWIQENKVGGGTHTYKINLVDIPKMLVPVPPLAEQQRILTKLNELDSELINYEKTEQKIHKLNSSFPEMLKKSILQQAVMGKLVPQNPNDEPASVLLERIREEKKALIKAGKIKKDKNESIIYRRDNSYYEKIVNKEYCIDDMIPFDIPDSWEWVRLCNIGDTNIGLTYKPFDKTDSNGTLVLRSCNIKKDRMDYSDCIYVACEVPDRAKINKGDILICVRNGSRALVGKCAIVDRDGMAFGAFMAKFSSQCNPFIKIFIDSPIFRKQLNGVNTETINQITQDMLKKQLCPLPSLSEQQRIVEYVYKLINICNKL